ncbi:MAG: RNA-binding protein [Gammaproteobacteria bacterium]|nr:RNA-binding protein [Gammaproteobacteria bacterium]
MNLPTINHIIFAVIISAILGAAAHFTFPIYGWEKLSAQQVFLNGAAIGSFIALVLASIFGLLQRGAASSSASTNSGQRKTIFVGNLAFKANSEQLRELFAKYGNVHTVRIMTDRMTRRPRGFAFVEMDEKPAAKAIKALNGLDFMGRDLRVNEGNERKPREERSQKEDYGDFTDGE